MNKEQLIKEIHGESIIIDGHYDLLLDVVAHREKGMKKVIETRHLPNFKKGGFDIIVSSIFIENEHVPMMALQKAIGQISALYSEIDESHDLIMLCKNVDDIMTAKASGKVGIMLSFEGVEPLYNDLSLLRSFYELGVRFVGLTWSRRNYAAHGCPLDWDGEIYEGGLTQFGKELVQEAERLGMIIDVSHLNDQGFDDVFSISKHPVIASHSNARAVTNKPRNLTDDQLKVLAETDGVAGINVISKIAAMTREEATLDILADHVEHIVKTIGVEHVSLGLDCCDMLYDHLSPSTLSQMTNKAFDIIKDHSALPEFTSLLIDRGFTKEEIKKIYGENLLRIYKQVLK
ncbi:dipeptidase [Bacillaceae bacterium W0354]